MSKFELKTFAFLIRPPGNDDSIAIIDRGNRRIDDNTGEIYESVSMKIYLMPCDEKGEVREGDKPYMYRKPFARLVFESMDADMHVEYRTNGNWPILQETLRLLGWDGSGLRSIDPCLAKSIDNKKLVFVTIEEDERGYKQISWINAKKNTVDKKEFADIFDAMLSADSANGEAFTKPEDDLPF